MSTSHIPEGNSAVTPYLFIDGAAEAIDYYAKVFNAMEIMRMPGPGGKLMHAEIKIGDSVIMLADENPDYNALGPKSVGGTPVMICAYVKDVDSVVEAAIAAGGTLEREVQDQFYGDRSGAVVDPFGHRWTIATHIEDVSPEEMEKRMAAMGGG